MQSQAMRIFTTAILLLLTSIIAKASLNDSALVDTSLLGTSLNLPQITIKANRLQQYQGDTHVENINLQAIKSQAGANLGQVLQQLTSVNIKAYGSGGGLATVSLRGANASQTQINWNGFSINSITLGSCDLSMVPSSGFQNISIVYGASGPLYGSGTLGGAINLDNSASFTRNTEASIWHGWNSLKTNMTGVKMNASNDKIALNTTLWSNDSKNTFSYYDNIYQKRRKQDDGAWQDHGFIQNVSIKTSASSTFDAGVWYQQKAYHIPSLIGSTTYEFQKDSALRVYARYKMLFKHSSLEVKAASFMQQQTYWKKILPTDIINSIDSKIKGNQQFADISYHQQITSALSADLAIISSFLKADVNAYQTIKRETNISPFAGIKYQTSRWTANANWRYEWSDGFAGKHLWSASGTYNIMRNIWLVRASVAQKYRRPSFNERYWIPGGDINLKPEAGTSLEAGTNIIVNQNQHFLLTADASFYYYLIHNMISWQPNGSIWTAKNYQEAQSKGSEIVINFQTLFPSLNYKGTLSANLNHSIITASQNPNDELLNHTMPYSPRIITSLNNCINYKKLGLEIWHHFTSDRFINESQLLDPFQLVGSRIFVTLDKKRLSCDLSLQCDNLFNTQYQLIYLYPMPPRNYSIRININIK
jgi:outer membrane cobalamin receptor